MSEPRAVRVRPVYQIGRNRPSDRGGGSRRLDESLRHQANRRMLRPSAAMGAAVRSRRDLRVGALRRSPGGQAAQQSGRAEAEQQARTGPARFPRGEQIGQCARSQRVLRRVPLPRAPAVGRDRGRRFFRRQAAQAPQPAVSPQDSFSRPYRRTVLRGSFAPASSTRSNANSSIPDNPPSFILGCASFILPV
ncbi:hypothetical protein [Saccharibacillus qingshengii]|uniref:hypothetical protein n=1 Tax=Saccharibacillus qingshengii TaxID=1763540 RepID=UPI00155759FB|nr:hypothetical protein [Saccharibacillus qingshengii]